MTLPEALSMGLVAGLTPSPHSVYLSCVGARERRDAAGVLLGGLGADLLIISLAAVLASFPFRGAGAADPILRILSLGVVLFMGLRLFAGKPRKARKVKEAAEGASFLSGAGIQLVNIHPYLFWMGIFFPAARNAPVQDTVLAAGAFLAVTYGVKWIAYVELVQSFPATARSLVVRAAFVLFAVSFVLRQVRA